MTNAPEMARRIALVVDDYRDTADLLAELLEDCGFQTAIAHDGEQGLQMADALQPEMIVLDICLPKLDGIEVCRRIRGMPWSAHTRIVAVTGQHLPSMQRALESAGFDEVLAKPYTFREISEMLEHQHH